MNIQPVRYGNIWLFADGTVLPVVSGGDGTDDGGDGGTDDSGSTDDGNGATDKGGGSDDDEVARLRRENAKHRTEKNQTRQQLQDLQTKWDNLTKVLGGKEDDPDALQKAIGEKDTTIANKDQKIRELEVGRMLDRAAIKHNADADVAEALVWRKGLIKDDEELDQAAVDALIEQLVKDHPSVKKERAPGKHGGDDEGGKGGDAKVTDVRSALAAKFGRK